MSNKQATILGMDGKKTGSIELPETFREEYDPLLIKRAVLAAESAAFQPQGVKPGAGFDTSAEARIMRHLPPSMRAINVGHSRLPRKKNRRGTLSGAVARVQSAVGGMKAHPPKVQKTLIEKINKKERKKALRSAIASSTIKKLILARHSIDEKIELPLIIVNEFEKVKKTSDVVKTLTAIGVYQDVLSAKNKRRIRAGKGTMRGRKYKKKKSLLIVTGENSTVFKAARNLEGVEITAAKNLNTKLLAPGSKPGRLTIWTENAIKQIGEIHG